MDLSNGIIGAANLDSDEEIQQDYSEEENAKEDATIRDKDCRDVKKIFDIYIQQCKAKKSRLPCSGFDATHRRHLSHHMIWPSTHRKNHVKCMSNDFNNNAHWSKIDIFPMKLCTDFFELNVAEEITSKNVMQKYLDVIEQKNLTLKENLRIKLALKTQLERKNLSAIIKRHAIYEHFKIPLKFLSTNNENTLLEVAWDYSKHGMSMLHSLLFLSLRNTCMATFLRFDSLHSTCFEDMCYHARR